MKTSGKKELTLRGSDLPAHRILRACTTASLMQLIELMRFIRQSIEYGWNSSRVYHNGTAMGILEKANTGAKFTCGTFVTFFRELCELVGRRSREVILIRPGAEQVDPKQPESHFLRHRVVEVDLNSSTSFMGSKWILFDPTWSLLFQDRETSANLTALDVHTRLLEGEARSVKVVRCGNVPIPNEPAYRTMNSRVVQVAPAKTVARIHRDDYDSGFLRFYAYLFYRTSGEGSIKSHAIRMDGKFLERHENKTLEETVGRYKKTDPPLAQVINRV